MELSHLATRTAKLFQVLQNREWRRALLYYGTAAGIEHCHLLRSVPEIKTIVDIGAHRGQFALAARACLPNARILSFEPLPSPCKKFRSAFASDTNTKVYEYAIGPSAELKEMYVSGKDDSSSLLPITPLQSAIFRGTEEKARVTVRMAPLDSFVKVDIERPAFLKIDVQGFELSALRGCESLLHCFSYVYVECSYVELYKGQALAPVVAEWLAHRRFVERGSYNLTRDKSGTPIQADFLFEARGG